MLSLRQRQISAKSGNIDPARRVNNRPEGSVGERPFRQSPTWGIYKRLVKKVPAKAAELPAPPSFRPFQGERTGTESLEPKVVTKNGDERLSDQFELIPAQIAGWAMFRLGCFRCITAGRANVEVAGGDQPARLTNGDGFAEQAGMRLFGLNSPFEAAHRGGIAVALRFAQKLRVHRVDLVTLAGAGFVQIFDRGFHLGWMESSRRARRPVGGVRGRDCWRGSVRRVQPRETGWRRRAGLRHPP